MEDYEKLLIVLEEFERSKSKEIPKELDDYIAVVAKTGNIIYPWVKIKSVYRSKITFVLSQFFESFPTADVSQFSFESMKSKILERFDQFISAPFTIQRLSELLINPRKEYNRIDKYMRAIEKNILVVSGVEPGCPRQMHLNGGVEMIEETFQVSSTSLNEDFKERVDGIEENDVTTEAVSENGQGEEHKAEENCENKEEELKIEDSENGHKDDMAVEETDCNGNTSTQEKIATSEESMMNQEENNEMEFSSTETDVTADAIIENETDETCKPDASKTVDDLEQECSQENTSVNDSVPEGNDTSEGPVISEVESCDTVAEVEAIAESISINEDVNTSAVKSMETDDISEENMDTSPPKEESQPDNSDVEVKTDGQNIDVINIDSSIEVHAKTDSDSDIPTKVLILSSPTELQLQENMNCAITSESEVTENDKGDASNIKQDEISSASEKLGNGSDMVSPEKDETSADNGNAEQSKTSEHESPAQATTPVDSSSQESENPTEVENS